MASIALSIGNSFVRRAASASRLSRSQIVSPWISNIFPRSFVSYPPHEVIGLPKLSPTMAAGSIGSWNLGPGDSFSAGDVICTVETDKAAVDFEATDDGVLAKILAPVGSGELQLGDPIMITVDSVDHVAAFADFKVDAAAAKPPAAAAKPADPPVAAPATPAVVTPTPPAAAGTAPLASGDRVFASPLARMLAKELGYPIEQIPGTGPDGRVIAADVKGYTPLAAAPSQTVTPAPALAAIQTASPIPGEGYTDFPLSEHAQEVAARLQQSKRNVPHYYLTVDVNMNKLLKTRASLNASLPKEAQLGVYEFLLKAAAAAMKTVPSANASWMDTHVRVYDQINLNVVVGSGDSLYTPVINNVGAKGLKAISAELQSFTDILDPAAKDAPSALGGLGTFTVMNLGMYGIKSCAPIIREPQSCALAIGALENRIIPNDDDSADQIYKEAVMMTATLSCDHRVVDGAVGAQWLASFKSLVENPNSLLL